MMMKMCTRATLVRVFVQWAAGDWRETRKRAAILCSDVVGYSRLAGADEDRVLARLRTLRSDLIDPTIAVHHRRVVKRTGGRRAIPLSHCERSPPLLAA